MTTPSRLASNSLWLAAARFGTQAAMVVFTILLARRLGSAGFGEYAFIAAALAFANIVSSFGTDMLLIREIAADGRLAGLAEALLIQVLLSALLVLAAWSGAGRLPNQSPQAVQALKIYSLSLFPLAFFTVFTSALRGMQRMNAYAVLNLSSAMIQLVVVAAFFRNGQGLVPLAFLLLAVQVAVTLLAGALCLGIPGFRNAWTFSFPGFSRLVRLSSPLGLLALLGMLYQKLSLLLVSILGGAALTGWFSAAQKAVEASKTAHVAAFTAIYPAMSQAHTDAANRTSAGRAVGLSWQFVLAGAAAISLVLFLLAGPLTSLLFGPGYAPAAGALRILAWMLIPYTANTFLNLAFLAAHAERSVAAALLASLIALGVLSAWGIPRAGLAGAAWAALAAECVQACVFLVEWQRLERLRRWLPLQFPKLSPKRKSMAGGEPYDLSKLP